MKTYHFEPEFWYSWFFKIEPLIFRAKLDQAIFRNDPIREINDTRLILQGLTQLHMKKVLINVEERELRVAILEDEQLVELYIESLDEKSILNNIYKGRIEGILPGLKAAFVNIGLERNAFLHFDDVRQDLILDKYKQLHPEIVDVVPSSEVSISDDLVDEAPSSVEDASTDSEIDQDDLRGKRRRGKRGGKKHRRDHEDTYTPGLPVGITEDDLDDSDEDQEVTATSPSEVAVQYPRESAPINLSDESEDTQTEVITDPTAEESEGSEDNQEQVRLSRADRNKLRREKWEQKKQERRLRRQQMIADSVAASSSQPQTSPPTAQPNEEIISQQQALNSATSGTRGAHSSSYDSFSPYSASNQNGRNGKNKNQKPRQNWGDNDNFGNYFPTQRRGFDARDSQEDFFGAYSHSRENEYSVWDDKQPDSNRSYGFATMPTTEQHPKVTTQANNSNRPHFQRNRNNNNNNNNSGNNKNKKRSFNHPGKNRHMKRRNNNSFYAAKAIDELEIDNILIEEPKKKKAPVRATKKKKDTEQLALLPETDATIAEEKPKKTTRTKKVTAPATASEDVKTKPATKRTTTAKKKAAEKPSVEATKTEPIETEKKPTSAKKTTTRRKPVKSVEPTPSDSAPQKESKPDNIPAVKEVVDKPALSAPTVEKTEVVESPVLQPTSSVPSERKTERVRPSRNNRHKKTSQPVAVEAVPDASEPVTVVHPITVTENAPQTETTIISSDPAISISEIPQSSGPEIRILPPIGPNRHNKNKQFQNQKHGKHSNKFRNDNPKNQQNNNQKQRKFRMPTFTEVFKKGDEVMVQVVKEEIGMKGARISTYVSLPGRYLVLLPYSNETGGISRKVEDITERKRLKTLLKDISTENTGFIVRTAGIYRAEDEIREDVQFLNQEWKQIDQKHNDSTPATLVYDDHNILYRLARDVFDENIGEILIDSHTECEKLKGILGKLIPSLTDKVKLYSGPENIFHKFQVEKQIQKAARRKVWLKSGGYLIIDEAEALTAIDVNTGKSVGKDDQEKLILKTNLEAARAVARELKLRDIGGLIVIDFIDMKDPRNRDQVLTELKSQLRKDRSKTSVSSISEFGLVEMTRKRVRRSLRKTIFTDCPYCQGAGVILNEQQIWLHIKHELVRILEASHPSNINLTVNPKIRLYIDQNYKDVFRRLEQKYDTEIHVSISDVFHMENYQLDPTERVK